MLVEKKTIPAMIRREKARLEREWNGRGDEPRICCEGCKKEITDKADPQGLEISQTKRGSLLIWHSKCSRKAWDSKIC